MQGSCVARLVAESPQVGHLAESVQPEGELPSRSNAKEIWKYLAGRLVPTIAESRSARFPAPLRAFKRVQTLALAAQISDFSIADYEDPTSDRWHAHMGRVNAFIEFCAAMARQMKPEFDAMQAARRQLSDADAELERTEHELQQLERLDRDGAGGIGNNTNNNNDHGNDGGNTQSDEDSALRERIEHFEAELQDKESSLARLNHELERELEPRSRELTVLINRLEASHAEFSAQAELLRPLFARGFSAVQSEVASYEEEVGRLQRAKTRLQEHAEKFTYTLQVLQQLQQELEELNALKSEALSEETRLRAYEGGTLSKERQHRDKIAGELARRNAEHQSLSAQLSELTRGLDADRETLAALEHAEEDAAAGSDADGAEQNSARPLERALHEKQARVDALNESNRTLGLTVKSQRSWLQGAEAMEKEGHRMAEALQVLKQWMKNYLGEDKQEVPKTETQAQQQSEAGSSN